MTLTEHFETFHAENPHVYETLVTLTRRWVQGTGRRCAIDMLFNVARWEIGIQTNDAEYKLNDHHRAFYSRLIMYQEPDLEEAFEIRTSEADQWLEDWIRRHPRQRRSPYQEMLDRLRRRQNGNQ